MTPPLPASPDTRPSTAAAASVTASSRVPPDGPDAARPPDALDPRTVYAIVLLCLVVGGLLTSARLVEIAERQRLGSTRRAVMLAVTGGVHGLAARLGFDRPAEALDLWLGRAEDVAVGPTPEAGAGADATAAAALPLSATPRDWSYFPTPGPTATATRAPSRPISPDAPLSVLAVGDSFAEPLGYELLELGAQGGMAAVAIDARISTGIARPDYFDWPAHLATGGAGPPPEALVIFMGANDDQNMITGEGVVQLTTPEWRAEYARRAATVMDVFADDGTLVYWVGLPVMRDAFEHQVASDINAVLAETAAERPWARYVDIWPLFADPAGQFATYLPNAAGEMQHVRQNDGIHLTRLGTRQVAAQVYAAIGRDWDLTPPTPTPTPTHTPPPTETPTPTAALQPTDVHPPVEVPVPNGAPTPGAPS